MRIINYLFFSIIAALLLSSCASDIQELSVSPIEVSGPEIQVGDATQSYENVDDRLWTYFERFEKEAKTRGVFINLHTDKIHAGFDVLGTDIGLCNYDATKDITFITINKDEWISGDNSYKELLAFHYIGKCYLGKLFNNDATTSGVCKSIMRSEVAACSDNYNANTRDAYLDELFTN